MPLTNLINLRKENHKSFFRNHNNNIKHLWKGIKEIVNINSKNLKQPTLRFQVNEGVNKRGGWKIFKILINGGS